MRPYASNLSNLNSAVWIKFAELEDQPQKIAQTQTIYKLELAVAQPSHRARFTLSAQRSGPH